MKDRGYFTIKNNVRNIVTGAVIAGAYAALTMVFAPISFGVMQVRISEALTILPVFTPAAVPGLFIGCMIANLFGGMGFFDIVFGSAATLLAALLTRLLRKNIYLAMIPPVLANAVIIGYLLSDVYAIGMPFYACAFYVGVGQLIACYALGLPLYFLLKKYSDKIFKAD